MKIWELGLGLCGGLLMFAFFAYISRDHSEIAWSVLDDKSINHIFVPTGSFEPPETNPGGPLDSISFLFGDAAADKAVKQGAK